MPAAPEQASASPGPVALVGSGEYLDVMVDVDRALLLGRPRRAVFLPTAAAEEGEKRVRYWLELGDRHFTRLGVEPVPLPVLTRQDAGREELAALVAGAGLVYLSGGNPGYLAAALRDTPVWTAILAAWHGGAALAGCSAGACALSYAAEDVRAGRAVRAARSARAARAAATASRAPAEGSERSGPDGSARPSQEPSGLAVIPEVAVIPHYDRMLRRASDFAERYLSRVPPEVTIVGVDEDTAIVTDGDAPTGVRSFTVAGRQSAWVVDGAGHRTEHPAGSSFSVPAAAAAR